MRRRPDPPETAPQLDVTDDPDVLEDDPVGSLLAELGGAASNITVHVFKRRADGNRIGRCKRIPLEEFDVDALPVMFGGGDFVLRVVDDGPPRRFVRKIHVSFDPSIFPPNPARPAEAAARLEGPAQVHGSPVLDRIAQLEAGLREERDRYTRLLEKLLESRQGPNPADLVVQIKALMDITRGPEAQRTPVKELAEVMRTAMEFAREAGGGGAEADPVTTMISTLAPKFLEFLSAAAARPVARAAVPPAGGAAPVGPAAPPVALNPSSAAAGNGHSSDLPPEWAGFAFLRAYTDQFLAAARSNMDPAMLATYAYENIPDENVEALEAFVRLDPAARLSLLTALDARLGPFQGYTERIADRIRLEFDHDADPTAIHT